MHPEGITILLSSGKGDQATSDILVQAAVLFRILLLEISKCYVN